MEDYFQMLRINALRTAKGWTLATFAEKANIAEGTARTYDRDSVINPNRHVLRRIANAFELPIAALFADYDKE